MRASMLYVALLAVAVGGAKSAYGQSASASVTAEVQRPITVTKTADLDFKEVFPGVDKTVDFTSPDAAQFTIFGQDNAQVHLSFVLPATLSNGANTLVISNWSARHNSTNSSASGTDFTPSVSPTTATLSAIGYLYLFLGAKAEPTSTQAAGTYTGTATLTVVYF